MACQCGWKVVLEKDTSSDELMVTSFSTPLYYDLVAQTDDEKMAVRKVVAAPDGSPHSP